MYYSFYMNEKLAIDNWSYYDDCNWLLTHLLAKDDRKTTKEKVDFYFEHRHEREENWWYYDEEDNCFKEAYNDYINRKMMYEDFLEYGEESGVAFHPFKKDKIFEMYSEDKRTAKAKIEAKFDEKSIRNQRMNSNLREINEVILYKSDFECLNKARKEHRLTELQLQILFGMIFFSRMHNVRWCRLGTDYKLRGFKACFDKTIKAEDIRAVDTTGLFSRANIRKGKAFRQLGVEQAEYLHIEDEYDWVYLNFDNKDEVAYVFKTTVENNRLNLSLLAKEVIPNYKAKYCSRCGSIFEPNSNRQHLCANCKKEVEKEQARLRKQKQRRKNKD